MLCHPNLHTKVSSGHLQFFGNFFLALSHGFEFFHSGQKVAAMLIGVFTRTPGVAPRAPLDAIVHQNIFRDGVHGLLLLFDTVDDFIEGYDPVHDGENIFDRGLVTNDSVILINTKLHLNLVRLVVILQAKERRINHQLFHVCRTFSSFQIMNPEHVASK